MYTKLSPAAQQEVLKYITTDFRKAKAIYDAYFAKEKLSNDSLYWEIHAENH